MRRYALESVDDVLAMDKRARGDPSGRERAVLGHPVEIAPHRESAHQRLVREQRPEVVAGGAGFAVLGDETA